MIIPKDAKILLVPVDNGNSKSKKKWEKFLLKLFALRFVFDFKFVVIEILLFKYRTNLSIFCNIMFYEYKLICKIY